MIDSSFLESGRSFNGYELDHILGEGGMGSVWKARQLALHRPVAIKFLKPEQARDTHLRQRFVREGEAAARVRGPHVVEVFDVGTVDDELPYLVMEYLEGEDLRAMLLRAGALPVETLVDLLLPVCAAIQTAPSCPRSWTSASPASRPPRGPG
jgi:serine/threonine protein kinase